MIQQKSKGELLEKLHKQNCQIIKLYKEFSCCREMSVEEILSLNVFIESWRESLFNFRNEVF